MGSEREEPANRVSARTGSGRKGTRKGPRQEAKNIFTFGTRQIYVSSVPRRRIIFFSTYVCVHNHSSSPTDCVACAVYTIIVKNFRKIVSGSTCSFLEMLRCRVEDPRADAPHVFQRIRIPLDFFPLPNPCGKKVSSLLYQRRYSEIPI